MNLHALNYTSVDIKVLRTLGLLSDMIDESSAEESRARLFKQQQFVDETKVLYDLKN